MMRFLGIKSELHYFDIRVEKFLLRFAIFILSGILLELCFFPQFRSTPDRLILTFIFNVIFLDSIHLICPFLILMYWPSGRLLWERKRLNRKFIRGAALLTAFALVLALFNVNTFDTGADAINWSMKRGLFWLWLIVPLFHGIRQSTGIAILNSKSTAQITPPEGRDSVEKFILTERRLMRYYCAGILISTAFTVLDIFEPKVILIGIPAACSFFISIYLSARIYRIEAFKNTNKFMASLRFMIWPFGFYSLFAQAFITLNHSVEYFGLMGRSAGKKTLPVNKIFMTFAVYVVLVLIYEIHHVLPATLQLDKDHIANSPALWGALALMPFITLLHYSVDSVIYRFSDKDVRDSFGEFLVGFDGLSTQRRDELRDSKYAAGSFEKHST